MKTIDEMRAMSVKELNDELLSLRKDQFNLRMKKASGALDKTHIVGLVKKAIARIKTIITEKAGMKDDK